MKARHVCNEHRPTSYNSQLVGLCTSEDTSLQHSTPGFLVSSTGLMRVGHDERGESVLTHDRKHKTCAAKLRRQAFDVLWKRLATRFHERTSKLGDFSILVEIFCARSAQPNCAAQRRQAAPQAPLGGAQRRRRRQAQTRRLRAPLSPLFCTTFHFPRS